MQYVDSQTFAGAMSLGATQAGMTLIHKVENLGGFGMPMCEANRDILGQDWTSQVSLPHEWEVPSRRADVLIGNPPCS